MLKFKDRLIAFTAGILFGPAVVFAGLESATYISDLVSSNPLSSDLASTADDHLRLIKSTVKTTFPNINNAITVTDEQINAVGASGVTGAANPTGTIGLSAVNGSATTFLRSDGAPALSQAIAPTWSAQHIFSKFATNGATSAIFMSSTLPRMSFNETDGAADNKLWTFGAASEQLKLAIENDANNAEGVVMTVDRTTTTVDRVTFPTVSFGALLVGVVPTAPSANGSMLAVNTNAARSAAQFENTSATVPTVYIGSDQTGGNTYVHFYDGGDPDTSTGTITTNGTTTAYNTSSDQRLKNNFKPAPSAKAVIDCIPIESYDWRKGGTHVDHGLVAQRLYKCAPYAVKSSADPAVMWGVDPSKLVPALIKYVQEQDARITQQENRIRELEAHQTALLIKEVEELRNRMAKLEDEPRLIQFESVPAANRGSIQYNPAGGSVRYNIASDRRAK